MTSQALCHAIRKDILSISRASGHGHIPTCFSIIEMLCGVYETMRHDPKNPDWDERDIFILSKGHASLALYCVLARFGYFPIEDVYAFGKFKSNFGCHPDRKKVPGVEASTGSLGHGIGLAVGMALAFQIQKSPRNVYTLIGDGESNEGTVWESIMVATNLKLNNLTILYDFNRSQSRSLQLETPKEKFASFGCETYQVNGHDASAIKKALAQDSHQAKVIVADTIKGNGCPTLEDNVFEWHRKSPDQNQLETLMRELDAKPV